MYPFATKAKSKISPLLTKGLIAVISILALVALLSYWFKPQLTKFDQAKNLIHAGKAARAVPILEELVRRNPDDISVLPWLAKGYLACDRLAEGRACLDEAIKLRVPPDKLTPAVLAYASYYQNKGDCTGAESLLAWSMPYCLSGEVRLAKAKLYLDWAAKLEEEDQMDEAIEKLELAHAIIPEIVNDASIVDAKSYATIISEKLSQTLKREAAIFETKRKSNVQAIACLKKSLSISDQPSTRMQLAYLYKQNGQRRDAIAHLQHVIKNDPKNATAKHALIELLIETKNVSAAKLALQELMKTEPSTDNYQSLARLESKSGNYALAAKALEEAASLKQDDLMLLKSLESVLIKWADALAARGDLKECLAVKEKAARVQAKVFDIESGMSKRLGQAHVKPKAGQEHSGSVPDKHAASSATLEQNQNVPLPVEHLKVPILPKVPINE